MNIGSVIPAPSSAPASCPQLDDTAAVVELKLSLDEIKALGEGYEPYPVLGHA